MEALGARVSVLRGRPAQHAQPRHSPSASFLESHGQVQTVPAFCDHSSCPVNLQGKNFAC